MADYDNNMRGVLFKNDKKGNDRAPDYKGQAEVERIEYDLSAWIRKSKSGETYMSIAIDKKSARAANTGGAVPVPQAATQDDDDIPF